jgi:hypothetical protein
MSGHERMFAACCWANKQGVGVDERFTRRRSLQMPSSAQAGRRDVDAFSRSRRTGHGRQSGTSRAMIQPLQTSKSGPSKRVDLIGQSTGIGAIGAIAHILAFIAAS